MRILASGNLVWLGSAIVLLASGCGKKSTTAASANTPADLIAASDLSPGSSLTSELAANLPKDLAEHSDVYANQPTAAASSTSTDPCTTQEDSPTVTATTSTLTFSYNLDFTACQNSASGTSGITYQSYTSAAVYELTCVGADLSSFNGKTIGQLSSSPALTTQCTSGTLKTESVITLTTTTTTAGSSSSKFIFYSGHADLTPCQITVTNGSSVNDNACLSIDKSTNTETVGSTVTPANSFYKFTQNSLTSVANSTTAVWFTGGTLGVTYNSWTGTLTYTNATTPPTYVLTDATQGTIQGSLTATAALALQAAPGPVVRPRHFGFGL